MSNRMQILAKPRPLMPSSLATDPTGFDQTFRYNSSRDRLIDRPGTGYVSSSAIVASFSDISWNCLVRASSPKSCQKPTKWRGGALIWLRSRATT